MTDAETGEEATLFPKTVGERLREARQAQGLTLAEVAARTRVPVRHLEAIEKSDYTGLPSATYSIGFAKAYARAIGMDEVAVGREVRNQSSQIPRPPEYQPYEMQDPTRLPPQGLAVAGAAVVVVLLIAIGLWYGTDWFRSEQAAPVTAPAAEIAPEATQPVPPPATPVGGGQVTLVATDIVWMKVYDAAGKTLYQSELKPGDRFDVPSDADRPMINIGRPDKLQVIVNGSNVAPLGDGSRAIKDVPIDAQSLLARGTGQAAIAAPDGAAAGTEPAPPPAFARRAPSRDTRRNRGSGSADAGREAVPASPTASPPAASPGSPAAPGASVGTGNSGAAPAPAATPPAGTP